MGVNLIKAGPNEKYNRCYTEYKLKLERRDTGEALTPVHKHNMALRYMVKQFIRDMWVVWRNLAGYDTGEPYQNKYNTSSIYAEHKEKVLVYPS